MSDDSSGLAIDLVLSLYTTSYQTPEKPKTIIRVQNGKTTKPSKKPRSIEQGTGITTSKATSSPNLVHIPKSPPSTTIPMGVPIPKAGTLNGEGFFLAIRNAGMRRHPETGKLIRHPTLILLDEKIAIAAFIGYNFGVAHGQQLEYARHKARYDIRPEKGKEYKRSSAATLAGFVKGMPSLAEQHLANLLAREQLAADLAISYEKQAEEAILQTDRLLFQGKALVERERLSVIRQDLIALAVARAQ